MQNPAYPGVSVPGPKPLPPAVRLLAKLTATPDDPDACWTTTCYLGGARRDRPKIATGGKYGGNVYASRVVLEAKLGRPLGPGMGALHTCDNPRCVRPAHLFEGTQRDNSDDKLRKGREAKGERHGAAKLSDTQVAEVVALRTAGWLQHDIAEAYGISQGSVSNWSRRGARNYVKANA